MKKNIILNEDVFPRPSLKRSDKYSAKELSQKLLSTAYLGYNSSIEPLLLMGLAIMAPFRSHIIKYVKGFPVGYLYGTTSSGKTNILNNVSFLFGYEDDYIYSGDSTVLSIWQRLDSCSSMPIIYDEISRRTLEDNFFEGLIKAAYQGTNRDKIAKIKTIITATLIVSSNFQPTQKSEILNRLLFCTFEPQNFKPSEVAKFNKIRENYLSNILPSIVKQNPDEVIKTFDEKKELIKKLNSNLSGRCINNIAVAYAGYQILLNIAGESMPTKVSENLKSFIKKYDEALKVETPWEEFISALPMLARNKAIIADRDYKYAYDIQEKTVDDCRQVFKTPKLLCIHFEQAYKAFSSYYRQQKRVLPPTQKELLLYAKNDADIHSGKTQVTKGININGIKKRCLVIDIKDNYELSVLDKM